MNHSTDPTIFEWNSGKLTMNGGAQSIEAAAENRGPCLDGLRDNFAFGTLTLPPGAMVEVVDTFRNQKDSVVACDEALYVCTLEVDEGAELTTMPGCKVYYAHLVGNGSLGAEVLPMERHPADFDGDGEVRVPDLITLLGA